MLGVGAGSRAGGLASNTQSCDVRHPELGVLWAGRGPGGHLAIAHCVHHPVSHPEGPTLQRARPGASSEPLRDTACTPSCSEDSLTLLLGAPRGNSTGQRYSLLPSQPQVLRTAPSDSPAQALILSLLRADTPTPDLPLRGTCSSPKAPQPELRLGSEVAGGFIWKAEVYPSAASSMHDKDLYKSPGQWSGSGRSWMG